MDDAGYQAGDLLGEIARLRERLSLLSQASRRINESLDFDQVLQGVLDSACSLTSARYGVMILFDDGGGVPDFLAYGFSPEEVERLWSAPDSYQVMEAMTNVSEPMRLPDLTAHMGSLGLTLPLPVEVFRYMAAPMFHRGARVGYVFVGDREDGGEFSQADEEILVMFAAQAALVIANAGAYREERRARADLETLVNTSPVGVAVFDARTGIPVSVNREALRVVESLRDEDQGTEDLLEVVTCVRSDGREVSLRDFTMAELLSAGETVRAEEITLRVPDGRSVGVLLNATPIQSENGELTSLVVTLQDLTPLAEQERLRAEFLATVSHELRAPLTSIKGSAATALGSPTELDPGVIRQFFRIIEDQADHMNDLVGALLDVARIETGALDVSPEPADAAALVDRARSAFISAGGRDRLDIDVPADLPLVAADRRRIIQVLVNLLTNAARHSPEDSVIRVAAAREDVHVAFSVTDTGRGIPAESLPLLFRKFSRARSEAQSGDQGGDTGLGLAICKGIVEAHGGRIRAESDGPGLGARFTFTLPTVGEPPRAAAGPPSALARFTLPEPAGDDEPIPILAVDDDPQALRYVHDALVMAGYAPVVTGDPDEALRLMAQRQPRLALLDLMMPGTDGVELMQAILETEDVPVIFLSAYGQEDIVARAFDMGAADYVVKPYSPTELAARIRAALRRRAAPEPAEPYVLGDLTIDRTARTVTLAGRPVPLVAMEYRLLAELSAHAGRVLTYEHLMWQVWGKEDAEDLRPMRTMVNKLRRKLGDVGSNPTYIFTEPRVGYRMPMGDTTERNETAEPAQTS